MNISEVKFAKSGDVHLAYQRYGAGPDVVVIPGLVSNVELGWEQYARVRQARHRQLGSFYAAPDAALTSSTRGA